FFDVMSLATLWWPQPWSLWIAVVVLLVVLTGASMQIRKGEATGGAVTAGVFSFFLSILVAAIAGAAIAWLTSLRAPAAIWVAQPGPITAAMWLIGIASALLVARPL